MILTLKNKDMNDQFDKQINHPGLVKQQKQNKLI